MREKIKILIMIGLMIVGSSYTVSFHEAKAEECPDLKIIFVRGSGEERWVGQNYLEFKERIIEKMPESNFSYEFLDLDYPAIGVDNLGVMVGTFFGAGEAYEFGESVESGIEELKHILDSSCKSTKFVLGGYSQGAMAISRTLGGLNPDKIIYAATFGDPKIYLPEGAGLVPVACAGKNLSNYRMYVPDCRAHEGLLGSYKPYQPKAYIDKLGTWCNKYDIMCSSHFSINSHTSYVSDNLYEDASRVIVDKVAVAFGVKNTYSSPHDTAILIDSTGSMEWMIGQYKDEASRLANETFAAGGRVALYDYRDLSDPYEPVARCTFETCTIENFSRYLDSILIDGGGDDPESLLSASLRVMNESKWRSGVTKSLVILTDAPFLSPDRDETTMQNVIELSKRIDPVNIYIITDEAIASEHPEINELAEATGGDVVTDFGNLNLLTDQIMERYDTLPRVEEDNNIVDSPRLEILDVLDEGEKITVEFKNTGVGTIIILNDSILGITSDCSITINNLNREQENELVLVPIDESSRGERVLINIPSKEIGMELPKTPDTGLVK